jgi:hypothetical protein
MLQLLGCILASWSALHRGRVEKVLSAPYECQVLRSILWRAVPVLLEISDRQNLRTESTARSVGFLRLHSSEADGHPDERVRHD